LSRLLLAPELIVTSRYTPAAIVEASSGSRTDCDEYRYTFHLMDCRSILLGVVSDMKLLATGSESCSLIVVERLYVLYVPQ
jgi:hypothetical protein